MKMEMRANVICLIAGLLLPGLAGCQKPAVVETPPPEIPATPLPATPPPATPVAIATPPPATPPLAPPGVFYLLEATRIETADGVIGLKPGTGLKLVRAGVYLSPYGEVNLREEQVTNDMGLARSTLSADQNAQAALKASLQAQAQQAADAEQSRELSAHNVGTPQTTARAAREANAGPIGDLRRQITVIQGQMDQIDIQLRQQSANRSASFVATGRRSVDGSTLPAKRRELEAQIQQLENQIRLLQTR